MVFISMINIYNFYLTNKKNVYFLFGRMIFYQLSRTYIRNKEIWK